MQFGVLVGRARIDLELIEDICRTQLRFDHRVAEKALIDAKVKLMYYKQSIVGVGMKPHAASFALAVAMIAIMKYTGDVPVVVAAVLAVLLVLCLKILQHLDLLQTGMQLMHETVMLHCSCEEAVSTIWSSVSRSTDMMQHMIKLFEGLHGEFRLEGLFGGSSYPHEDTPEDEALLGAHHEDHHEDPVLEGPGPEYLRMQMIGGS